MIHRLHLPLRQVAALLVLGGVVALAGCGTARASRPEAATREKPVRLAIVGTNDLHGWIGPREDGTGGLALLGGAVSILRQRFPDGVVLLDAGDLFTGTLESDLGEGAAIIAGYNALGYDAVAVGNHDFDFGPVGPRATPDPRSDAAEGDPLGALKARASEARFPLLAWNVYEKGTRERPAPFRPEGFVVVERQGIKIGIAGLSTPSTPKLSNPANLEGLRFAPLKTEALKISRALREAGAEIRILVVHEGGNCPRLKNPRSLYGCVKDGVLIPLLEQLPEGSFEAVIGGHTHQPIGHFVNGIPVIETGGLGTHFGVIELGVDRVTRKILPDQTRIRAMIPLVQGELDGSRLEPDPKIAAAIAPFIRKARAIREKQLGASLPHEVSRSGDESALGLALADALREAIGADFGMVNAGGLRADLPSGPLTMGHVFQAYPFANTVSRVTLTGAELVALLERFMSENRALPLVSGLRGDVLRCQGRALIERLVDGAGAPIAQDGRYTLATIDYLASGGNGLRPFVKRLPPGRVELDALPHRNARDALADWLKRHATSLKPQSSRLAVRAEKRCPAS